MKYPVRVYEVDRTTTEPAKPRFATEFVIHASTLEKCRRMIAEKMRLEGKELRTLCFSPDPAPYGSVVVYVWKGDDPAKITRAGARPKRRRGR